MNLDPIDWSVDDDRKILTSCMSNDGSRVVVKYFAKGETL
jgi:hypothetical protein